MTDWLRILGMIFYAPLRGIREARDRSVLGPAVLSAYAIQLIYTVVVRWLAGDHSTLARGPAAIVHTLFQSAAPILTIAVLVVPVMTLIANLFDRRGSFSVVLQQEYGSLAAVLLYVLTSVSVITILVAAFFHFSGIQRAYLASAAQSLDSEQMHAMTQWLRLSADQIALVRAQLSDPVYVSLNLFETVRFPLLALGGVVAIREVFRLSILRSLAVLILTSVASLPLS